MATYSAGRQADIYIIDNPVSTIQVAAITCQAVVTGKVYRVPYSNGDKRFIDFNHACTVKDNGVVKNYPADYKINGPCIVFTSAPAGPVTIENYYYFTTTEYGHSKSWSFNLDYDIEDLYYFESSGDTDNGWVRKMSMFVGATVDVDHYWLDADLLGNHATSLVVLSLFTDYPNKKRYECYGYLNKDSIKAPANGILEETLTFDVTGRAYYFVN